MDTSFEPTPAKRKCTVIDVDKMKLTETIREFDLPHQFSSTSEIRIKKDETKTNYRDKTISTSNVSFTSPLVNKIQKLRILSRNGRDLGEFNVQLRDDESKGKTLMLIKSPSKKDPVTVIKPSYIPDKLHPRILRQSKNFASRLYDDLPNVTLLSKNISETDKISTIKQQQFTTLLNKSKFRSSNTENKKVKANSSCSDAEIDIETRPMIKTSYCFDKLRPTILRQNKTLTKTLNVDSPNVTTFLGKTLGTDKISTVRQQQSTTLLQSNKFSSSNNAKNKDVKANINDPEIDVGTNKIISTCSNYQNVNNNNKEHVLSNRESNVNTCLEIQDIKTDKDNKIPVLAKPSYKDIKSISVTSGKTLVVRLTNCMKKPENEVLVNEGKCIKRIRGKCIANINAKKNLEFFKSVPGIAQGCNQDRKPTQSNSLENKKSLDKSRIASEKNMLQIKSPTQSSLENKRSLGRSRIIDEENMLQIKSSTNKQVHEKEKQENIMTIIPNNKTGLPNQPDLLSNIFVSSTSNKSASAYSTSTHQHDTRTSIHNKIISVSSTSNKNLISAVNDRRTHLLKENSKNDSCPTVNSVKYIQKSPQTANTTDTNMESSVQDLSNKFDIIKKAMDSVKDNELRELALKALADCGIGIERHIPIGPPEYKAVHDSQVQTMVFGLLDPKSFVLLNKDIESLYRVNQITLHDVEPSDQQEDNFDIDSFVKEFIKNIDDGSDVSKINETLSMSKLRCKNILDHLEKDFQSAKRYDQNGKLNIHNAVLSNNIHLVRRHLLVLRQCKESVDISTDTGMTSLELAIKYDVCKEIVKVLLDAGAQPVVPEYLHESAVIIASKQSSPLLPMLVEQVTNRKLLDQVDSEGYAALHYCSIYGNLQGVQALLSAGATIDLQDKKSGRTPLFHALDNSHKLVAETLLKAGATAYITNYAGQTPIISIPNVSTTETESLP